MRSKADMYKKLQMYEIIFVDLPLQNGSVAQLVEHDTLNVGVVGSSPTGTTDK